MPLKYVPFRPPASRPEKKFGMLSATLSILKNAVSVSNRSKENCDRIREIAERHHDVKGFMFLGRGINYPVALEGALKLKEISYIHAEGYAAGEMKHGPIALIDESVPVTVCWPSGPPFEKTVSNLQEVATRGGQIILISDAPAEKVGCKLAAHIEMPAAADFVDPLVYAIPVQLLAYHTAVLMGTDVDQPRNLAKSVTVE